MRKQIMAGIGAVAAATVLTSGAGAALAAAGHPGKAAATVAAAHRMITRAQARAIAKAKVPHSRVVEVESDDRHDRAVWKVTLATRHGRVIVDVDKRTGRAVIVGRDSGGRDDRGGRHDRGDRGDRHDRDGDDSDG